MNYQNQTAKAAIFMGTDQPMEVRDLPLTAPKPGYALLKIVASGICGTDLHFMHGRLVSPAERILGHEFLGEIVDLGEGDTDGLKIGDKVIYNMAAPCGQCKLCKTGDSANCLNFEVANAHDVSEEPHFFGGFAEYCYAKANRDALIVIPDGMDPLAAALFPCAGPTIIHALKLGGIFANRAKDIETAVVQGPGPLGMFSALFLKLCGVPNVYVCGLSVDDPRMKNVAEITGANLCTSEEIEAKVAEGLSVDLCIECSGNPNAVNTGCSILRNRGIYLIPGQYSASGNISFGPEIITFRALRLIGSSQYDASDVADYINFLNEYADTVNPLAKYLKTYPVAEVNEAFKVADARVYTKVALN